MMKALSFALTLFVLSAVCLSAAGLDGKWAAESKMRAQDGTERTLNMTLDLKSEGGTLTGAVTQTVGPNGDPRTTEIQNGKIDGNKFSFTTVAETPRGTMKWTWEGTVDGDMITGTRSREGGGGRSTPFTAKRQ
jgi:hypothetical protein